MAKILGIDVEATGLIDPEIIELGVILTRDDAPDMIIGETDLIKPNKPISLPAMAVHNITEAMVANAAKIKDSQVFKFTQKVLEDPDVILLGYNIGIDLQAYHISTGIELKHRVIDMYKVVYHRHSYEYDAPLESYRLNFLRYYYGLNDEFIQKFIKMAGTPSDRGPHSALFDTLMTVMVFHHMLKYYSLEKMLELSAAPLLLKNMLFGKNKDKSFEEVAITDYPYLQWLLTSEMDKCKKKGMGEVEMKNNALLGTILYFLDKYKPK